MPLFESPSEKISIYKNNSLQLHCSDSLSFAFFLCYSIGNILFLFPVSVIVFSLGVRKCWATPSTKTFISHCDALCYNLAVIEMIGTMGIIINMFGYHLSNMQVTKAGILLLSFPGIGQMVFAVMTCLDRYLAVVYPINYLRLRRQPWIKIRNIIIGATWLLSFTGTGYLFSLQDPTSTLIPGLVTVACSSICVLFFSSSILKVLIRPKPGEAGESRSWFDRSKKKAFYNTVIIMTVLLFRFGGTLLSIVVTYSHAVNGSNMCSINISTYWFNLPSSLVLPLLFLHKEKKQLWCQCQEKRRKTMKNSVS